MPFCQRGKNLSNWNKNQPKHTTIHFQSVLLLFFNSYSNTHQSLNDHKSLFFFALLLYSISWQNQLWNLEINCSFPFFAFIISCHSNHIFTHICSIYRLFTQIKMKTFEICPQICIPNTQFLIVISHISLMVSFSNKWYFHPNVCTSRYNSRFSFKWNVKYRTIECIPISNIEYTAFTMHFSTIDSYANFDN